MRKLVVILIAVFVLAAVLIAIFAGHSQAPDVNIVLSPSASTSLLDGTKKIGNGKQYVSPGKHSLTVSFSGFASQTILFTAQQGKVPDVTVLLLPNSSAGYLGLNNHPNEQAIRRQISGQTFNNTSTSREQKLGLINSLPYVERYFRVDYGPSKLHPSDDTAVAIYITTYGQPGVQQALAWITSKGYDPNSLEIIYNDQSATN
jgi:hypothetical protein